MFTNTITSPKQAATKIENAMTLMIGKFMTIGPP